MFDLDTLNPQQKIAAMSIDGPLLILAGAGSGKTKTVTFRIAHMIKNLGLDPKSILAVSFTNKAANEMKERLKLLLGRKAMKGATLSTFHSLALKILREDIHHIGYSRNFTIYDSADQLSIVREGLKYIKMEKLAFDKKQILSRIGFLKNRGIKQTEFTSCDFYDPESDYDVVTAHIYNFYQEKLEFYNALDFDDILFLTVELFNLHPEVAKKYSERYRYIMVDEYQDTNSLQFDLISSLTQTHSNLCVVGDDDQSIYGFRGADITNILNFERIYKDTTVVKLEQNYRSTAKILSLANVVIKKNRKRKDKTMRSSNHGGGIPQIWGCADTEHEGQIVIDEILRLQKQGHYLKEIAILYRSNTQVPPFEDQLRLAQIPYNIVGGQKFYEKKEIKDLIAYLSVIHNPKDELALRRILNVPNRGVGNQTLKKLLSLKTDEHKDLFDVIKKHQHEFKNKGLAQFTDLIDKYRYSFAKQNIREALGHLIEGIDYMHFVEKSYDSPKIAKRKKDDVQNFLLATERFIDRFKEAANLETFLERLLLADNSQSANEDGELRNEVQLMTLHSSKGLEFDTVFLVGCEEELLPHKNTIKRDEDIDEERRLFYVGITRARIKLYLTHTYKRKIYGKDFQRYPSRFVLDVTEHYLSPKDRTGFAYMSEEEEVQHKSDFFNDLLGSLDD